MIKEDIRVNNGLRWDPGKAIPQQPGHLHPTHCPCSSSVTWMPARMEVLSSLTRDMESSRGSSCMSLITIFTHLAHQCITQLLLFQAKVMTTITIHLFHFQVRNCRSHSTYRGQLQEFTHLHFLLGVAYLVPLGHLVKRALLPVIYETQIFFCLSSKYSLPTPTIHLGAYVHTHMCTPIHTCRALGPNHILCSHQSFDWPWWVIGSHWGWPGPDGQKEDLE